MINCFSLETAVFEVLKSKRTRSVSQRNTACNSNRLANSKVIVLKQY